MNSRLHESFLTRRISRRSFAAGTLATGGLLAAGLGRVATVAAADFAPGDIVVTTDLVNLRDAPSLSGNVITVLGSGISARIEDSGTVADGYTWYKVTVLGAGSSGDQGYVAGAYLVNASTPPNFPVGSQIIVNTDALNVRSGASLNAPVAGVATYGAVGNVLQAPFYSDGYWWIQVAFPDVTGWVVTDFVQLYSGGGGKFNVGDWVYVNSGPLNMRQSPGLNGTILRTLPTGETGQITAAASTVDGYIWYQMQISTGEFGWVVQDFLSAGTPPPPSGGVKVGDTIKVVDGPLNIRSGPGTSYGVIDWAATGAIATVVDGPTSADGYTWIEISGNLLQTGWVAFEFCQVV